jgi:hypothetical protein
MTIFRRHRSLLAGGLWAVAVVGSLALVWQRALHNLEHIDFRNSNFVFFWLAGRMVLAGQNPYDAVAWLANHDLFDIAWRPNQIFPYPLPLAVFLAPLGILRLPLAYFLWQIVSAILILACIAILLVKSRQTRVSVLFVPLAIFALYYGPVLLTLQIGAMGAFTLVALVGGILALEHRKSFLAGSCLALTMLKPPQGVPILLLAAAWLVARRDWQALLGILSGGLLLLIAGVSIDPAWPVKFLGAGRAVLDRTLGMQSNMLGFAYLACSDSRLCMWAGGLAASALILGAGCWLLWRQADQIGAREAFTLIIPLSFVSALYLWSYDQVLYVIPVVWIVVQLLARTRSYAAPLIFLVALTIISLWALLVQATTRLDLLSGGTTVIVLGAYTWIRLHGPQAEEKAARVA